MQWADLFVGCIYLSETTLSIVKRHIGIFREEAMA